MNKSVIPKLVNILLIVAFISPLIYGLYLYDWDINRFVGFKGAEVYVDLSYNVNQLYESEGYIVISLEIKNIGDAPVNLTRLEALLNATLDKQMHISQKSEHVFPRGTELKPGEAIIVDLKFPAVSPTGGALYFRSIEYSLEIKVDSEIYGNPVSFSSTLKGVISQ